MIIAQGGEFGGWSLYLRDGAPRYCYNLFGLERFHVGADQPVPSGTHQVRMEFANDRKRPMTESCKTLHSAL